MPPFTRPSAARATRRQVVVDRPDLTLVHTPLVHGPHEPGPHAMAAPPLVGATPTVVPHINSDGTQGQFRNRRQRPTGAAGAPHGRSVTVDGPDQLNFPSFLDASAFGRWLTQLASSRRSRIPGAAIPPHLAEQLKALEPAEIEALFPTR